MIGPGLKSAIPSGLRPFARDVYYRFFRFALRLRCFFWDLAGPRSSFGIPLPPARLRYRVSESFSAQQFLDVGNVCAELVESRLTSYGTELTAANRILDFGCGCGRTARWFLARNAPATLHGVDVDGEAIAWCGANLTGGQFTVSPATPPLSFPSEYFDAVYCISVFTHLDEAMQDKWLAELARVLKPGGVLVFTIHGDRAARTLDKTHFEALQRDGMLHLRSRKLAGLVPDWYNTSWHTRGYIIERTSRWFCEANYYSVEDGLQDFVSGQKRASGAKELV